MAGEVVDASVVLTADNAQYDQAMQSSAGHTEALATSVDSLSNKLNQLSKNAGRKMLTIAAVDVAGITAATAAYAAYEKQMESLSAQAAILHRSTQEQNRTFKSYEGTVNGLRSTFAMSTREAAALTQQLSKMGDGTERIDKLANTFGRLAAVSGEAPTQLAQSVLQLQRTMGMPQRETEKFANTLTNLATRTNTTVTGIAEFSQSIGPMARQVGMTANEVAGVSTAFIRAGQDGYQAANAFNKILGDISYATATGSPDLAKYANLIGVTVENFKSMDKTEAVTQIFETLNRQGPQAITTLNRLGLDGLRTQRAITALAQGGGLRSAIREAQGGDADALGRGSKEAMDGIIDSLSRTRSELTQTAESMGKTFSPIGREFAETLEAMAKSVNMLANSPLGKVAAGLAAVVAPLAGLLGGALGAAAPLLALAGANQFFRSNALMGFRDARTGQTTPTAAPRNFLGNWLYQGGQRVGGVFGPADPNSAGRMGRAASWITGRGLQGVGIASRLIGAGFNPLYYNPVTGANPMMDPQQRDRLFRAPTFREAAQHGWRATAGQFIATQRLNAAERSLARDPTNQAMQNRVLDLRNDFVKQTESMTKSMGEANRGFQGLRTGLADATKGLGYLARNMMGAGVGALSTAGGFLGRGAGWAFNQMGGSYLMMGMLGAGVIGSMQDRTQYEKQDFSNSGRPYMQAAGLTGASPFTSTASDMRRTPRTTREALKITSLDQFVAQNRPLSNSALEGMSDREAIAYLSSQYQQYRRDPKALDELKLDLLSEFGATRAFGIMQGLDAGFEGGGSQQFFANAGNISRRSWARIPGFLPGSEETAGKQINLGFGVAQDRINQAAARFGPEAGWSEASKTFEQFTGEFARSDAPLSEFGSGKWYDPSNLLLGQVARLPMIGGWNQMSGEEEAWLAAFQQNYGLSSFDEDDYKDIRRGLDAADSNREAFTVVLQKVFDDDSVLREEQQALLDRFGVDPGLEGQAAVDAIIDAQMSSDDYTPQSIDSQPGSIGYRLARIRGSRTVEGDPLIRSVEVQKAIEEPENRNAQLAAVQFMYSQMAERGMSPEDINRTMGRWRAAAGSETEDAYRLGSAVQQWSQQIQAWQMPTLSRPQQFAAQTRMFQSNMASARGDVNQQELQMGYMQQFAEQMEGQRQYWQQMLYQRREYDVMVVRAEEDYALQREYAQEDFHRSRMWQEQDYALARERGERNFRISQNRAQQNFNISRRRQEREHQHQVVLMTQNAAKQMMDIYERVSVQRTSSAEYILYNAQDQLERMREQASNLDELRRRGMSNRAIDQLNLNDPQNAQQLETLLADIRENPELVRRFNRMISQRIRAAQDLVTDESDTEWREFMRRYRINRNQALRDFRRVTDQARDDHKRIMGDMEDDHRKMMNRQVVQHDLVMDRQADAYERTMKRAASDLERAAKTIDGNLEEMLEKSVKRLGGHAQRQAAAALGEFRQLKQKVPPEAVALMQILADVFKVDYKAPNLNRSSGNATLDMARGNAGTRRSAGNLNELLGGGNGATGGVVPGWSPGIDNQNYVGPGGQKLSLSGGEAIMRPEFTRAVGGEKGVAALNQAAVHNRFFKGGVFPVSGGAVTNNHGSNYSGYNNPFYAVDINKGSGFDDMGAPVRAWRRGTVARVTYVGNTSYGRYIVINHPGGNASLYAHLSDADVQAGERVRAGQVIGNVGSLGVTSPHLHFEISGNQSNVGSDSSGYGGGGGAIRLSELLQDNYPKMERLTASMNSMQPLQPGDISKIYNRFARRAWRRLVRKHGRPVGDAAYGMLNVSGFSVPESLSGNVMLGKQMADSYNWHEGEQWAALRELWNRESGWNHKADNPDSSAFGIPQAMMSSHWPMPKGYVTRYTGSPHSKHFKGFDGDPRVQIAWGLNYIKNTYGSPRKALSEHNRKGWYGDGSVFTGPQTIGVGERGPEAVIPLNDRGAEFIQTILDRSKATSAEVRSTNTAHYGQPIAHNMYNTYQIDKSTNFSGPITVQANDTRQFLHELRQRQRTAALTQPQLAGAR